MVKQQPGVCGPCLQTPSEVDQLPLSGCCTPGGEGRPPVIPSPAVCCLLWAPPQLTAEVQGRSAVRLQLGVQRWVPSRIDPKAVEQVSGRGRAYGIEGAHWVLLLPPDRLAAANHFRSGDRVRPWHPERVNMSMLPPQPSNRSSAPLTLSPHFS